MDAIEAIVSLVSEATGYQPVVKGGNRNNPLEYFYSRTGVYSFRLEIYINGDDLLAVQSDTTDVYNAINDFGDNSKINGASVTVTGGGTFTQDNIITQAIYLDVYDYGKGVSIPSRPDGSITLTTNGTFDVAQYAFAEVAVSGGRLPDYEGSYDIRPLVTAQVLPTENRTMTEDLNIQAIPYEEVHNPEGGLSVWIGREL